MRTSIRKQILIIALLTAVLLAGCQETKGEGERSGARDRKRISRQEEHSLPERQYAMAAVTEKMIYGCYLEDDRFTIALFSRESGRVEKQVPLPEKVSYVQDMRVDDGGNLYVTSGNKLGSSDMRWKIDARGNLREI